ncbi:MAG: hypothetical protein QNJ62_08055 [Methyloceanibacter sp.]|nr:hypothetical protein [Methyloceanibacter sp.]
MTCKTAKGFRRLAANSARLIRLALLGSLLLAGPSPALAANLFNVAQVHVDVTANDAVVAREKGMAEAETKAFGTLLARLVPLSMQSTLPAFSHREIEGLVAGVAIHSEKTSHRRYVGVLDVRFYPGAVRQFLSRRSIPYVESQASPISILPVMLEVGGIAEDVGDKWHAAWARLDLKNGVAPATLVVPRDDIDAPTVRSLIAGDTDAYASLRSVYGYGGLVVAVGEVADGLFQIRLVGADAAGDVNVTATSSLDRRGPRTTWDRAAQMGLRTLERRWQQRLDPGFDETAPAPFRRGSLYPGEVVAPQQDALGRVSALIEFPSVRDWQQIRFGLQRVEDLRGFEVVSRSARAAEVVFDFNGSADQLQALLAQNGIALYQRDGALVIRASVP